MSMLPSGRPQLAEAKARALLAAHGVTARVALIGIRGYFRASMGKPAENDFGVYDDAIVLVGPRAYEAFNANTDPSRQDDKLAQLVPGIYPYRQGMHGISRPAPYVPYPCLRPATLGEKLPVLRGRHRDFGVAINIHRGGHNGTSSEGCQTVHPDQYEHFIHLVYREMDQAQQATIPYLLLVNDGSLS